MRFMCKYAFTFLQWKSKRTLALLSRMGYQRTCLKNKLRNLHDYCFIFLSQWLEIKNINLSEICHTVQPTFWRQITFSTADADKGRERVCEDFLFAKLNKRICGPLLIMEQMLNVWRYCSSNLTLFHAQTRFLSTLQHLSFNKTA